MARVKKRRSKVELFISYRRDASQYFAHKIIDSLRESGYDVFVDIDSLRAGSFEEQIFENIASRPVFLLILTPTTLERCDIPNDFLKREIEFAIDHERHVIPVVTHDFNFNQRLEILPEALESLLSLQYVKIFPEYFAAGIERLRSYIDSVTASSDKNATALARIRDLETTRLLLQTNSKVMVEKRNRLTEIMGENNELRVSMNMLVMRIQIISRLEEVSCPFCGQLVDGVSRDSLLSNLRDEGEDQGNRFRANVLEVEQLKKVIFDEQIKIDALEAEIGRLINLLYLGK